MNIKSLCDEFIEINKDIRVGFGVSSLVKYREKTIFVIDNEKYWQKDGEEFELTFSCVGGSVEKDETVIDAVQREIREEIGVEATLIDSDLTYYLNEKGQKKMIKLEDNIKPIVIYEHRFISPEKGASMYLIFLFKSEVSEKPVPSSEIPAIFDIDTLDLGKMRDEIPLEKFHTRYKIVKQRELPLNGNIKPWLTPKMILDYFEDELGLFN